LRVARLAVEVGDADQPLVREMKEIGREPFPVIEATKLDHGHLPPLISSDIALTDPQLGRELE
jgi:hypothetical protein